MAVGACRHCGVSGVATDAPVCRACGGWRPNPGRAAQLGVVWTRVSCVFGLLLCLVLTAAIGLFALLYRDTAAGAICLLPATLGGVWQAGWVLVRSFLYPYGHEVAAE